jgi:hypothetical protein
LAKLARTFGGLPATAFRASTMEAGVAASFGLSAMVDLSHLRAGF